MGLIVGASLNWIGTIIYNWLFGWIKTWGITETALIGTFGVTVIMFSLFLKLLTSPLDLWQKNMGRKNARVMKLMKPELEALQRTCGSNQQLYLQKQREIYKKYNYSMGKACLPMIVTMVVFIVVISGFSSAVKYHNEIEYTKLRDMYLETRDRIIKDAEPEIEAIVDPVVKTARQKEVGRMANAAASDAVLASYKPERFLFTQNIFISDNWSTPVPTYEDFQSKSMGKMGIEGIDQKEYNAVMGSVLRKYNYNDKGKKVWNGFLILPILAMAMNFISSKLIKPADQPQVPGQTDEQRKMAEQQQKMMAFIMPLIFGVFTLFYSTAFTVYFLISNIITLGFNLIYNIVAKKKDAEAEDRMLSMTIKK